MARGKFEEWLEPDSLLKIEAWARDGLTEEQVSTNMGVSYTTLRDWKKKFPPILAALKKGKEVVDIQVENALLKRALGYEYVEVTEEPDETGKLRVSKRVTKHMMPDTTAQIFWLKNRKREWSNKDQHDIDNVHANMELTKAKTGLIKGAKSDTSMMETLIEVMSDDK